MAGEFGGIVPGKAVKDHLVKILDRMFQDIPDDSFIPGTGADPSIAVNLHALDTGHRREVVPNMVMKTEFLIDLPNFSPHSMLLFVGGLKIFVEIFASASPGG